MVLISLFANVNANVKENTIVFEKSEIVSFINYFDTSGELMYSILK